MSLHLFWSINSQKLQWTDSENKATSQPILLGFFVQKDFELKAASFSHRELAIFKDFFPKNNAKTRTFEESCDKINIVP